MNGPFSSQQRVLVNHPVFQSISIITYPDKAYQHNLIGSGKVYLNFLYGDFKKINTDGTEPKLGICQLQPVENHFTYQSSRTSKLIRLAIKPYFWFNITGESAKKSSNKHFDLNKCIPDVYIRMIHNEMREIDCPDATIGVLDHYLSFYYSHWHRTTPVADIIETIFNNQGNCSIEEILNDYQLRRSTLNAYFDKYIGVSPKFYIRLIYFNHLLKELLSEDKKISEMVSSWDYYDYSHFKRDFILFTGLPPKNIEELKGETFPINL